MDYTSGKANNWCQEVLLYGSIPANKQKRNGGIIISLFTVPNNLIDLGNNHSDC